jgi:TP901 family phage tail tape measure protein
MNVIGEAYVTIRSDGSAFAADAEKSVAPGLAGVEADADASGLAAGQKLRGGVKDGLKDVENDVSGVQMGGLAAGAGKAGDDAAKNLKGELDKGLEGVESDADSGGSKIGSLLSKGMSKGLGGLATVLGSVGIPMDKLKSKADDLGKGVDSSGGKANTFTSVMSNLGKTVATVGVVGLAAFSAVAIKAGMDYQSSTNQLAASAGISIKSATAIGNAFLDTGGKSAWSGAQILTAYKGVASQLATAQGHALNVAQAVGVMTAAQNLAEGSGIDLGSATSALASVMQVYGINAAGAAGASDTLFQTSKLTGTGVDSVAKSLAQMHTQLGALTPPMSQTAGLMVDLTEHGETGSRAIRSVSTAFTTMVKSSTDITVAQNAANRAFAALPPSLQALANQYKTGTMTAAQVTSATKGLTTSQAALWSSFTSASTAVDTANTKYSSLGLSVVNAQGKFVGIKSVIEQLGPKLAGMGTQQQRLAALQDIFGTSSVKLLTTIQAGPAAYDKATAEIQKHNSAQDAAQKMSGTLARQFDVLKSQVVDVATKFGVMLIPIVEKVAKIFLSFVSWIMDHKIVFIGLAAVIGTVLVAAIGVWIGGLVAAAGAAVATAATSVVAFGSMVLAAAPLLVPIGLIVAAIAAIGFAIYELVDHWSTVWAGIKSVTGDVWHFIDGVFHDIENDASMVLDWIKDHWQLLLAILTGPFGLAVLAIKDNWQAIVNFFEAIPGEILSGLSTVGNAITQPFTQAASWVNTNVILPVVAFFTKLPSQIANVLTGIVATIWSSLTGAAAWVNTNVLQPVISAFTGLPKAIAGDMTGFITTVFSGLTGAWQWIDTNVYQPIVSGFSHLPTDIGNAIGDALSGLGSIGKDIINWIIDGMNDAINFYDDHRPSVFGVSLLPHIDDIPKLAAGGIVSSPTLAILGESGPEAVIPLGASLQGTVSPLPGGSGSNSGNGASIVLQVAAGAVVINPPPGANTSDMNDSIARGFNALGQEVLSGVAPMRSA